MITATGICAVTGNIVTMTSGTGTCSLAANWASDNNYLAASATQSTTGTKIAPTDSFAGAPVSAPYQSMFTVTATTNASTTATLAASGSCSIVGTTVTMTLSIGTCSLSATWATDNNYLAASASQSTAATKATPQTTFTGAPAIASYHSSFTVVATTNASSTAIITASGSCTIAVTTVTVTKSLGTCSLSATWAADNNYLAASATQSTTATKATPVITWATPAAITYGTKLGVAQLNAKATSNGSAVAGSFAYSPAAGAVLGAGRQTLSVNFIPTDSADFNSASGSVTLVINQDQLKIIWPKPAAIVYETPLSSMQLNATATDPADVAAPGTFVYTRAAGSILSAGTQTLSVRFTPTDTTDYTSATGTATLLVNKDDSATTISNDAPNPSLVGQSVTVSIGVTDPSGSGGPTGIVTVKASTGEACSGTLATGAASCSLTFGTAGSRTLTASYGGDSNFKNSSAKVTQSVIQPKVTLSAGSLTFANQKVNNTSGPKTVTLTNSGAAPLNLFTVTISGDFAFASGTTCVNGGTISPAGTCLIFVTFTPTATGARTGNMTITDNAAGTPQKVTLTGTGN